APSQRFKQSVRHESNRRIEMSPIENKWWFSALMLFCAVLSEDWLLSAVGLTGSWLNPWSFPRVILFLTSVVSLYYLYVYIFRAAMSWLRPLIGKAKSTS
ncbi:MAG TPA: hypothetical protein VET48_02015, partial [Steroidobacteraceae bacterium]|nr:hypothetical protein [Steroidobacteraceae bacterium]